MAVSFLDSSALVKRYVREIGTDWIMSITDPRDEHSIYLARITAVEVISAIVRRQRGGSVSEADAVLAMADFCYDLINQYRLVDITPALVTHAMSLAEMHALRAYDAIQLAAALTIHAEWRSLGLPDLIFVSADQEINAAASAEALAVDDPNGHENSF